MSQRKKGAWGFVEAGKQESWGRAKTGLMSDKHGDPLWLAGTQKTWGISQLLSGSTGLT